MAMDSMGRLDETDRCGGTMHPPHNRGTIGLCFGCARFTMGPADWSGLAFKDVERVWVCLEHRPLPTAVKPSEGTD
jgi:hypothetical protein